MIKQFLLKLQQNKKRKQLRKWLQTEQELKKREAVSVMALDYSYKITEVELEVLKQGNKKLYIQHLKREGVLKIKKKLDKVFNDTEIARANEIFGNIYFEENEGKLYILTRINLETMSGFDETKNAIEIFKRKSGIIEGFIWR